MKGKLFLLLFFIGCGKLVHAQDLRGDTVDIRSILLNLDLSDFTTKVMRAKATLGVNAKKNGVEGMKLDLLKLTVDSVKVNSFSSLFDYNDSLLNVNLLTTLNTGDSATVEIYYHGTPYRAPGDFGGFYWTGQYAFNIGVSFLADPHNYGRVWFPCFDNFEVRSNYEFFVTTKNTHKAFCNGLLQGVTTNGNKKIWHWKLGQQIPSYLASVAVSDYATVSDTVIGLTGVLPVDLAANATDTAVMKSLFVHLKDAFHIQEDMWGPYLWDRVGYCIVPFSAGAMEHATNIGFMNYYLSVLADEAEHTMAHELSHHWFGNLVTCATASDMWLNEGWARYNEHLFAERLYGDSTYNSLVRINHKNVLHTAHVRDLAYLPVSGVPTEQTYGTTVYDKGADVIHTLRYYMGDGAFFSCVKSFIDTYKWNTITTEQLRDYLTQCSGVNLNDYFADWVKAPGFPHFSVENYTKEYQIIGSENYMRVHFTVRQKLHHAPHYYNNVPVQVAYFAPNATRVLTDTVWVSGQCTDHTTAWVPVMTGMIEFAELDFEGNLQDAITDEWQTLQDTGTYDFGTAKMLVHVNTATNAAMVRVAHNWVRAEPMKNKIAGLHLHDKRYWTVSGNLPPFQNNITASAVVYYNGTDQSLDSTFFISNEDSLLLMYRANNDSEWVEAPAYTINKQGSANDKSGYITITNLLAGQYCMAIRNAAIPDTTTADADCVFTSIKETQPQYDFKLYPNPTNSIVTVEFEKDLFDTATLLDVTGKRLTAQKIVAGQSMLQFNLKTYTAGTYLVELTGAKPAKVIRKVVKQ